MAWHDANRYAADQLSICAFAWLVALGVDGALYIIMEAIHIGGLQHCSVLFANIF
jgi:hypothetical protein